MGQTLNQSAPIGSTKVLFLEISWCRNILFLSLDNITQTPEILPGYTQQTTFIRVLKSRTHLLVSESLSIDEEPVTSKEVQIGGSHLTHAHPAEPAPFLSQPTTAGVVPCHHHCLHAHQVVVTAEMRKCHMRRAKTFMTQRCSEQNLRSKEKHQIYLHAPKGELCKVMAWRIRLKVFVLPNQSQFNSGNNSQSQLTPGHLGKLSPPST